MTLEELEIRAARWGADIRLWPETERGRAEDALEGSEEARALFAALAAMEADLSEAATAVAPLSDDLTARILADAAIAAPAQPRRKAHAPRRGIGDFLDRLFPAWRPAAACAASAFLGIWIGYLSPESVANAATQMATLDASEPFTGIEPYEEAEMSFDLAYVAPEAFR